MLSSSVQIPQTITRIMLRGLLHLDPLAMWGSMTAWGKVHSYKHSKVKLALISGGCILETSKVIFAMRGRVPHSAHVTYTIMCV